MNDQNNAPKGEVHVMTHHSDKTTNRSSEKGKKGKMKMETLFSLESKMKNAGD